MLRSVPMMILLAGPLLAQQIPGSYPSPYGPIAGPQSFAPNVYNRGNQPLSPYLNLGNSVNPAASYYYGVRPGTQGPNGLGPTYGSGGSFSAGRGAFLPPDRGPDAPPREPGDPDQGLRSPGGPVVYGNVFGSSKVGVNSRGGFFGGSGGSRPSGGTTNTTPRTGGGSTGGGTPGSISPIR